MTLIANWPLNENTGTSASDVVGSKTATLANSGQWIAPGKFGASAIQCLGGSLRTSLTSFWELEESAGSNRVDAHGGFTLSDGGAIGGSGVVGGAASFNGTSQYLSSSNATFQHTTSMTWAAWVNLDDDTDDRTIVSRYGFGGSHVFAMYFSGTTKRFSVIVVSNTNVEFELKAESAGRPILGKWYLVIWWIDTTNNLLGIEVSSQEAPGLSDEVSYADGLKTSSESLIVGAMSAGGGSAWWDGNIDQLAFWKKVLTSGERVRYRNGGHGLSYGATATGGPSATFSPIPLPTSYTVAAWVRDWDGTTAVIVGGTSQAALKLSGANIRHEASGMAAQVAHLGLGGSDWYHLAAVRSGGNVTFYKNSVSLGTAALA